MTGESLTIALFALGTIFSIIGWLLKNAVAAQKEKTSEQTKLIETLFRKHDEDARRLDELRLEIARKHYVKEELDSRFDKLETTTRRGFEVLTDKFDDLAKALLAHIQKEDLRP